MTSTPVTETAEMRKSFETVGQIDAGLLNVGYMEAGRPDGAAVVLLHGWPYDIHSYVDVVPLLVPRGYRVIVPYLRGYGTTRFRATETFRNGQPTRGVGRGASRPRASCTRGGG